MKEKEVVNIDDAEVVELGAESEADELSLADKVISSDDTQERYWQLAEDVVVAEKEIAEMVPVQKGFHRFQLKPPFRSLIVLTYSSIPVSLNDTPHRDSYGLQAPRSLWPSSSKF